MAFDQVTRNRLQKLVSEARSLLTVEFTRQLQNDYGLDPESGNISPIEVLTGLDDERLSTAKILRETFNHYQSTSPSENTKDLLERIVREQAFTMLNRFAAIRMAEARGILFESISNGYQSKGFQLYSRVAGSGLGSTFDAYRNYIFSVFDELALDLAVLFDRFSPFGRLFPRQAALEELLGLINDPEIDHLWAEDETIGWIYQYFNSKDERKKMRDDSPAPRDSRELAVRNQFFTPRYVVEFLTDNTLGRNWYEMTRGDTALVEKCRYLVRRPNEIFLDNGEDAPLETEESNENLSQEELVKRPVYISYSPLKDPREILMLDPACGSMHFGLYAFDLLLTVYEDAWRFEETKGTDVLKRSHEFRSLHETYENDKGRFLCDVPRLIIENNIHGVDIDPRAVQIAGLSLWLRAQRAWQQHKVKPNDRPQIRRSNIVCAEPMPGEADLLEEFIGKHFSETPEKRLLGEFVRRIFDSMKLAGEAGSLLKIEEQVADLIAGSREQWRKLLENKEGYLFEGARINIQPGLDFEVGEITAGDFWDRAEGEIYKALRGYAETGEATSGYERRLFADDAAQGFAFIDICRKKYDSVLMNPPFGETTIASNNYVENSYRLYSKNILCAFLERLTTMLTQTGRCGSVIDRTILIKNSYEKFRKTHLLDNESLDIAIDLGWGVLDANVEVASLVVRKTSIDSKALGFDVTYATDKEAELYSQLDEPTELTFQSLKEQPFAAINFQMPIYLRKALKQFPNLEQRSLSFYNGHTIKSDVFKRLVWEVAPTELISKAKRMWNGSEYSPFTVSFQEVVIWDDFGGLSRHPSTIFRSPSKHLLAGLCFGKRGEYLDVQILPDGFVLTNEGFGSPCGDNEETWYTLAYLNSLPAQCALNFYCGQHKGVGYVNALPLAGINSASRSRAVILAKKSYEIMRSALRVSEVDSLFVSPFAINENASSKATIHWIDEFVDASRKLANSHAEIDELFLEIFSVQGEETAALLESAKNRPKVSILGLDSQNKVGLEQFFFSSQLSYATGSIFGRWDARFATGQAPIPELPDAFAPLPNCPPGMLQNSEALPAAPEDVSSDYPVEIVWNGILVDDPGSPNDVENRVREVLQVIWKDRADSIETEACEILGVPTLREYFRRPAGFFADHLKRYSKSRRQAPIYLPLSTKSGDYTLWLYYHRLTDQTLYAAVNDFVDPKLRQVKDEAASLGSKHGRSRDDEKRLEHLTEFTFELEELRDELLRLAPVWKPNLNDGVQITVSPLRKLFKLPKWRKTLEDTWKKLEEGDYDWAHLAYSFFPERVREKCRHDKSLAIAHGLEDLYEEQTAKPRKSRTKQAQTASLPLADG